MLEDSGLQAKVEQTTGLPMLTVQIDRQKAARYGLNVPPYSKTLWPPPSVDARPATTMFRATPQISTSWFVRRIRERLQGIKRLPIPLPRLANGTEAKPTLPLARQQQFQLALANQVSRNGKRRIVREHQRARARCGLFRRRGSARPAQIKILYRPSDELANLREFSRPRQRLADRRRRLPLVFGAAVRDVCNVKDGLPAFTASHSL